jgi:hypothetical protein
MNVSLQIAQIGQIKASRDAGMRQQQLSAQIVCGPTP